MGGEMTYQDIVENLKTLTVIRGKAATRYSDTNSDSILIPVKTLDKISALVILSTSSSESQIPHS